MTLVEKMPISRSVQPSGFIADHTPSGTPRRMAQPSPTMARITVLGSAEATRSSTGRLVRMSVPRSPWASWVTKRAACTTSGWSSPMRSRNTAFCSAVARGPSAMVAGSPGTT